MSPATGFRVMTLAECEERLAGQRAGRVAWAAPSGPMILPVSYQLYLGHVSFRTSPDGVLSCLADPTNVAFEVDEIDTESGYGWSVLVRGRAHAVSSPAVLASMWRSGGAVPWASGPRSLFISIETRTISGRVVHAPFAAADRS